MSWQILLTISIFTGAFAAILQKLLVKNEDSDPIASSIVFQVVTGVVIGVFAFTQGFKSFDIKPILFNLIAMAFLYGIGNAFLFQAFKYSEASKVSVLFASRALWSIIAAIFFLSEVFNATQAFGTLLIISSIVIISGSSLKFKFDRGEISALLAAISFGLAFVNDAFIVRNLDVPTYLTLAFIIPGLLVGLLFPKSLKNIPQFLKPAKLARLILLGIIYGISAITIFLAYQKGNNAAQIAPLQQTTTILTVILAIIFLRESSNILKKIAAAVISAIGIILLR
jgi:drug/metabolite transporter (DMT)-like permease